MSRITSDSKRALEVIIRQTRYVSLLSSGIASLVALAFLKSVVIDYGGVRRKGFFAPSVRRAFMRSTALPDGVVVWICAFGPEGKGHVWGNYIQIHSSIYSGYEIYVCTYLVGHLAIQVMAPRWTKRTRKRPPLPPLAGANQPWSDVAVQVWPPAIRRLEWPLDFYLDGESLQAFKDRWLGMRVNPSTGDLLFSLPVTPGHETPPA
jgi:hypothetical protein